METNKQIDKWYEEVLQKLHEDIQQEQGVIECYI